MKHSEYMGRKMIHEPDTLLTPCWCMRSSRFVHGHLNIVNLLKFYLVVHKNHEKIMRKIQKFFPNFPKWANNLPILTKIFSYFSPNFPMIFVSVVVDTDTSLYKKDLVLYVVNWDDVHVNIYFVKVFLLQRNNSIICFVTIRVISFSDRKCNRPYEFSYLSWRICFYNQRPVSNKVGIFPWKYWFSNRQKINFHGIPKKHPEYMRPICSTRAVINNICKIKCVT